MRYRSRTQLPVVWSYNYRSIDSPNDGNSLPFRMPEEMWDEENTNWKEDLYQWIRHGVPLPVRPMEQLKQKAGLEPCTGASYFRGRFISFTRSWRGIPRQGNAYDLWFPSSSHNSWVINHPMNLSVSMPPEFSESHKDMLLQKALAKARTAPWDVGTFVAEFNKTARMIQRAGRNMIRRAETIASLDKVKTLQEFSSAWLEYRYGWRILYLDIMEANEAILRLEKLALLSNRYTTYDSAENKVTGSGGTDLIRTVAANSLTQTSTDMRGNALVTTSKRRELRAGVMIRARLDQPAFFDPLTTAIEITPYALVLNWFVNIKDAIAAWSPFARGELAYGFISERTVTRSDREYINVHLSPEISDTTVLSFSSPPDYVESVWYHRLERKPSFNLRWRVDLDVAKVIDGLSIVLAANHRLLRNLRTR